MSDDGTINPEVEQRVTGELKLHFRPEFLNRVDEIIVFHPLTKDQIKEIIKLSLVGIQRRLADREITLELTEAALDFIADEAYDPHYGARPINRYLQHNIETEIATGIIRGDILDGQHVVCDTDGEQLIYR